MRRILIAVRLFFAVLFRGEVARRVEEILGRRKPAPPEEAQKAPKPIPKQPPVRSDALTLLAALQREARLVDFLKEPLDAYNDAQIGAAARDVHRGCAGVLERMFALKPVLERPEGTEIEVPAGFDAGRYRLTGNVTGDPPFRGRLVHHGWEAAKCALPAWSGSDVAAPVVAPAEVELK